MLRKCLFGLVSVLALATSPAVAKPVDAVEAYNAAVDAFHADNCARVDELTPVILSSPGFASLEPKFQSGAFTMAGFCAINRKDWRAAYDSFAHATDYAEALDVAFAYRLLAATVLDHQADAVAALELAAKQRPAALSDLSYHTLAQAYFKLMRSGEKALAARYAAALDLAGYQPDDPFGDISFIWLDAAGASADVGDHIAVSRYLDRVHEPQALETAAVDRRFFALVDAAPQQFDVRRAAEQRLAEDREAMAKNPKLLEGPMTVSTDLRTLGRPEEALALLDQTLPRLQVKDAFTDLDDQLNWYWDERSHTLMALGRPDEAVAALEKGAGVDEQGGDNISQALNLADLLSWTGKPQAALDALGRVRNFDAHASDYARRFRAQIRVCALSQLGRSAEAAADRALLSAHEKDGWGDAVQAALCVGDVDGAAAIYIRTLADPVRRGEALVSLSEFDRAPYRTPLQQAVETRRQAVARRPDVQAAIAKSGRVVRFHVVDTSSL